MLARTIGIMSILDIVALLAQNHFAVYAIVTGYLRLKH